MYPADSREYGQLAVVVEHPPPDCSHYEWVPRGSAGVEAADKRTGSGQQGGAAYHGGHQRGKVVNVHHRAVAAAIPRGSRCKGGAALVRDSEGAGEGSGLRSVEQPARDSASVSGGRGSGGVQYA
jgi:hypothetical protein